MHSACFLRALHITFELPRLADPDETLRIATDIGDRYDEIFSLVLVNTIACLDTFERQVRIVVTRLWHH